MLRPRGLHKRSVCSSRMVSLLSYILSLFVPDKLPPRQNKYRTPLPTQCHVTLTAEELGDRPLLVVGDVHGCCDELCELMAQAAARRKDPFFVFVGDMINKGPHSLTVLRLLQLMVQAGSAAAVRGNHEESILRELWALHDNRSYTLPDRYRWLREVRKEDFSFLQDLPYTLSIPSHNALVVHAGLVPGVPLSLQSLEALTHMRNILQEDYFSGRGLVGVSKVDKGEAWAPMWPGPTHVYFGHDARRGLQREAFATGLDTGCLYGKQLTGVFVGKEGECQEFVSVQAACAYVDP